MRKRCDRRLLGEAVEAYKEVVLEERRAGRVKVGDQAVAANLVAGASLPYLHRPGIVVHPTSTTSQASHCRTEGTDAMFM